MEKRGNYSFLHSIQYSSKTSLVDKVIVSRNIHDHNYQHGRIDLQIIRGRTWVHPLPPLFVGPCCSSF